MTVVGEGVGGEDCADVVFALYVVVDFGEFRIKEKEKGKGEEMRGEERDEKTKNKEIMRRREHSSMDYTLVPLSLTFRVMVFTQKVITSRAVNKANIFRVRAKATKHFELILPPIHM